MNANTVLLASAWVLNRCRARSSHSSVAKKLSHRAFRLRRPEGRLRGLRPNPSKGARRRRGSGGRIRSRCIGRIQLVVATQRSSRDPSPERHIGCHATKRKISGGTRSDVGRNCRDAFLGLAKTCAKSGIALWDYLGSRFGISVSQPCRPLPISSGAADGQREALAGDSPHLTPEMRIEPTRSGIGPIGVGAE
jgi:hypothetical protein